MKHSVVHKDIEDALRRERPWHRAPPGFAERVIEALPARRTEQPVRPHQRLWPRLVLAGGLALIAVLIGFRLSPEKTVSIAKIDPAPPTVVDLKIPREMVEKVQALTLGTKIDQPLEKELERVLADTRNAIYFVASNFMPEN